MSDPASHFEYSPVVIVLIALTIIGVLQRMFGLTREQLAETLPKSAPTSNRTTRIAESLILFCAALAILVLTATNTSTGGRLLTLDQIRPGFAVTNVVVAVAATAGVTLGLLITLFRRTSLGVLTAAAVLCGYGIMVNGPHQLLESLAPEGSTIPDATLTFQMTGADDPNAELWINGVKLGTLPYETTFDEFHAKVPYWAEEPNELKRENMDSWLRVPSYRGTGGGTYKPWAQIELPKRPVHWDEISRQRISDTNERREDRESRTYYVRVKIGDEWGYATGSSGSGSGGGGRYERRHASVHFGFIFPERQERMEKLLDKARLSDYRVGPEWFEAMETFRQDGPIAVLKAMDKEPEMIDVLNGWARWKYDLDKVADPGSAWQAFERICAEADAHQFYSTASIAGRAVELLVDRLDPERLASKAVKLIRSTHSYGWNSWFLCGRFQFGMTYRPEGLSTGAGQVLGTWRGSRGNRLPVSGYTVAHAVWKLDELLDTREGSEANVVERKVVPALICWHSNWVPSLRLAAQLGGTDIERFLRRSDWRADPERLPFSEQVHVFGQEINGSLFLLANLRTPVGREFRRQESRLLMKMADGISLNGIEESGLLGQDPFGFLFLDKQLAREYWPRFKTRTLTHASGYHALEYQFRYLVDMEPETTVDMYVDAWRSYSYDYSFFQEALSVLDDLPKDRKEQVLGAIDQEIRKDVSYIDGFGGNQAALRDYLLRHIKMDNWTAERKARDIIESLRARTGEHKPRAVADWLEHSEPDHPLVRMLAEADDPELRLLVLGALREHPTPENKKLLQKLLGDNDERVRRAAMEVDAALRTLAETDAMEFAAGPHQREGRNL